MRSYPALLRAPSTPVEKAYRTAWQSLCPSNYKTDRFPNTLKVLVHDSMFSVLQFCAPRTFSKARLQRSRISCDLFGPANSSSRHSIIQGDTVKFFRYRRPSLKTVLGLTRAKKRAKNALGLNILLAPLRWWPNQKRRIKRKLGCESVPGRLLRLGLPGPGGGCLLVTGAVGLITMAGLTLLLW